MYMQEYTALYTSPSNNNSTGKPELTPIEEGALLLASLANLAVTASSILCVNLSAWLV